MNHNPFAVPDDLDAMNFSVTPITDVAPSLSPLHPLSGVVAATFLGTPIAGAVVIAISLWRLGRRNTAFVVVGVTFLIMVAFFTLMMLLPDHVNVPRSVMTLPQILMMYFVAKQLYGRELEKQRRAGGRIASSWKGAGIGLLGLVVILPMVLGAALIAEGVGPGALLANHGQLIEFENDEIYIAGDATVEDANRLAVALKELNFLGGAGSSVRIRRDGNQTIISFVVQDGVWSDQSMVDAFRQIGVSLTEAGFEQPLSIELCDANFEMQRSIMIE